MDLLCRTERESDKWDFASDALPEGSVNVLITTRNKIIKIFFYQTSLTFSHVDHIVLFLCKVLLKAIIGK